MKSLKDTQLLEALCDTTRRWIKANKKPRAVRVSIQYKDCCARCMRQDTNECEGCELDENEIGAYTGGTRYVPTAPAFVSVGLAIAIMAVFIVGANNLFEFSFTLLAAFSLSAFAVAILGLFGWSTLGVWIWDKVKSSRR